MLDAVASGRLSLKHAHDLICANGAQRYDLYPFKGALLPGSAADVTIIDLTGETVISAKTLHTHARDVAHLYEGRRLRGMVTQTILKGNTIFLNGTVTGSQGGGEFVTPNT
jgi:dihydroorotase-like cyclic amidohydrolase